MRQKTTSMRYLHLGSLMAVVLMGLYSCKGKEDAIITSEWLFINGTTSTIEMRSNPWKSFILMPGESFFFPPSSTLGSPNIKPEGFLPPYFAGDKILVNGEEHTLARGESVTDIKNYVPERIDYNYYRFTHTFTEGSIDWP